MKNAIARRPDAVRLHPGSWSKLALAFAGLGLLGALGGCASNGPDYADRAPDGRWSSPDEIPDAVPRVEPKSKYGNMASYVVRGRRYFTEERSDGHIERGLASWYGPGFHRRKTSSGEPYDMYSMTAAHKTLPLPTYARVTNLENGRSAVVRINDRGPFHDPRVIDLSFAAASKLGVVQHGTAMVEVRAIDPARPASDPGPFLAGKAPKPASPATVDRGLKTSGPMLADNAPRPSLSVLDDDWTGGARSAAAPARETESSPPAPPASPGPVVAAREPASSPGPAAQADPGAEAREREAVRKRTFEAALAALDAQVETESAPATSETDSRPGVTRTERSEARRERVAVAQKTARRAPAVPDAVESVGARAEPAASRKDGAKVAASRKAVPGKDDGAKASKGASATRDATSLAASGKKDAARVAAAAAEKGAAKADSASPGLYLQVGAFGDPGNAEKLRKKLTPHLAGRIRIQSPGGSGTGLYKVRVGPFGSEGEARKVSAKLASLGLEQPRRVVN